MELAPLINDLAILLAAAATISFVFHKLRLPTIQGYIIAGAAVASGAKILPAISDLPNIRIWGELGVIFLMFTLGLEFSFRRLGSVGVRSAVAGAFEITGVAGCGFLFGRALGWSTSESIFLSASVAISSTTILLKSIEELGLRHRRFTESVLGILIIEDLVAILSLVALSSYFGQGDAPGMAVFRLALRLTVVVGIWLLVGITLVPRLIRVAGRLGSSELMTILALGLCLFLVTAAASYGFSPALGAFVMGSIIAETRESRRIEELIRPLRHVFVAIFFVSIGMLLKLETAAENLHLIFGIAAVVVLGKFAFTMVGALLSGHSLRHSLQMALSLGQIGEFSFLLAGIGTALGVLKENFTATIVGVSFVTSLTTPLAMRAADSLNDWLERHLPAPLLWRLDRYRQRMQTGSLSTMLRDVWAPSFVRWIANGILVTAIFSISARYFAPWLDDQMPPRLGGGAVPGALAWIAACFLAAPFLLGLWIVFERAARRTRSPWGPFFTILTRLIAVVWIAALSVQFFSPWQVIAVTWLVLAGFAYFAYRHLENSYRWFEKRFMEGMDTAAPHYRQQHMERLAPWDAHLMQLDVGPDSEVVGKTLSEAKLRENYGLNVVAIQRGSKVIVAPDRGERIFPEDELLVLGNETQVEAVREIIERKSSPAISDQELRDYELRALEIHETGPLSGKSILASRLREDYGALVVGIERAGRRILNPPSQLVLTPGDRIWLVGQRTRLRPL